MATDSRARSAINLLTVARDGTTGIALARALKPDAVICDAGLPDVDGYEVARTLRQDEALRSTRFIALNGYAQPEDKERARDRATIRAPAHELARRLDRSRLDCG